MAGAKQVTYAFIFEGVTYGIKLPEGYYKSIDTKVGITEASDTNRPKIVLTKRQAIRNGALIQLGILYKKGTRLTRAKILCASAKLQSAISALENDTYRGFKIHSAYIPMQRRVG